MPAIPVTYQPLPYVSGGTLGELTRLRGRNEAEAHLRRGATSANLWQTLGQQVGRAIRGYAQEQAEAPRRAMQDEAARLQLEEARAGVESRKQLTRQDEAFAQFLDQWDGTPEPLFQTSLQVYGPQRGPEVAKRIFEATQAPIKAEAEAAERTGKKEKDERDYRMALDKAGVEEMDRQADNYRADRQLEATTGRVTYGAPTPAVVAGRRTFIRSGSDGKVYDLSGAAIDGGTVQPVEPQGAQGPQPGWQWVNRGGVPVHTNRTQPGDEPLRAPQNTGDTAQDRQRNARTTAAKDFLVRLNELRSKINTKMGPAAGITGIARRAGAAVGMDPDVAEYERIRAAGGRALAVAIMGAQNLSDADAAAWANMLPDARTDEETAARLTAQVERMLTGMTGSESPTPPAAQAAPGAAPASRPPSGTQVPNLSGVRQGFGRKFTEGPFAGQTWTMGPNGPERVN